MHCFSILSLYFLKRFCRLSAMFSLLHHANKDIHTSIQSEALAVQAQVKLRRIAPLPAGMCIVEIASPLVRFAQKITGFPPPQYSQS